MATTATPWVGREANKLYLTSGQFTSTLKDSQAVGTVDTAPAGISWDGINTPWCGLGDAKLYLQSGQFTSTLKTSVSIGGVETLPQGISWDRTNTPWAGRAGEKLYLQSGQFTSTLKTSETVTTVDDLPTGISYDGANTPWTGTQADKLYLTSGQFTSTLKISISIGGVDDNPTGISWDGTNTPWVGKTDRKLYLQSGQFTSTLKTSQAIGTVDINPEDIETDDFDSRVPLSSSIDLFIQGFEINARTNTFIDPVGGDNGGNGTIGNPYKTLQFAIDNTTEDTTNGNQFNVRGTGADFLASALDFTTFGKLHSPNAPVIIRGYTDAAEDGGIGDLDGSGLVAILNDTGNQWLSVIDMHLHNCGSAAAIWRGGIGDVIRCEVDTGTGNFAVNVASFSNVMGCYIHDFADLGVGGVNNGEIAYNYIVCTGDNINSQGIDPGIGAVIHHNVVRLTVPGTRAFGIRLGATNKRVFNNSIWSNAGIGTGVIQESDVTNTSTYNNLVEGFSGTGGVGISTVKAHGSPNRISDVHSNAVFNCETAYDLEHDEHFPYGDNEILSASPFADATNDDFTPQDVGNVFTGFLSTLLGPVGVAQSFPIKGAIVPAQAVAIAIAATRGNFDSFGG